MAKFIELTAAKTNAGLFEKIFLNVSFVSMITPAIEGGSRIVTNGKSAMLIGEAGALYMRQSPKDIEDLISNAVNNNQTDVPLPYYIKGGGHRMSEGFGNVADIRLRIEDVYAIALPKDGPNMYVMTTNGASFETPARHLSRFVQEPVHPPVVAMIEGPSTTRKAAGKPQQLTLNL